MTRHTVSAAACNPGPAAAFCCRAVATPPRGLIHLRLSGAIGMKHQTSEPLRRSLPSQGARVEDDLVRRIPPLKKLSPRRVAASLPFAIVAILVVATVAFGATVVRPMVISVP